MAAKLIGDVEAEGEGGEVYEEDGAYYVVGTTMVVGDDDVERIERTRSESYGSLAELTASLPRGVRFVPAHEASLD